MRLISWLLYGLAALAAIAACIFYFYINGLACAFGGVSGTCAVRAPWRLGGEDLRILVLLPLAVVLVLLGIGWLAGRRAR